MGLLGVKCMIILGQITDFFSPDMDKKDQLI